MTGEPEPMVNYNPGDAFLRSISPPVSAWFPVLPPEKLEEAKQQALLAKLELQHKLYEEDYVALDSMRVGDEERGRYITHLSDMFSKGYLDQEEFEDRMGRAAEAKNYGQLKVLLVNLPPLPAVIKDSPVDNWSFPNILTVVTIVAMVAASLAYGLYLLVA